MPAMLMEAQRLRARDEDVLVWISALDDAIGGVPAHFVLNSDEMGQQQYSGAKQLMCVVPACVARAICYQVSRRWKRITLIAYLASDGLYLRPGLILTRQTYEN
jgi:hypothetical protein